MKIRTYIRRTVGTGFLILVAWCSPLSGLCSKCQDGQCHDNGECIIGCVPGYVGRYCTNDCPSRCLNNACHADIASGAITCTDGCVPGYCDIKCEVKCPGDCVSCKRQCDSCNMTLCPERRYGADCSKFCSRKYSTCDRETGQCIKCKRGYYGNNCTKKCKGCFTEAENDMDTCHSGCDICKAEETCPVGYYGNSCKRRCSLGCDKQGHGCNKQTGECFAGCVSGYHGLTCNYTCSEHCLAGKCEKATRECSDGCVSGYYGMTCNYTCNGHCLSGKCNRETEKCSNGCMSGYHGLRCNNTCNKFCVGGICNQHNGICTSGCVIGYISNLDSCESNEGTQTVMDPHSQIVLICFGFVAAVAAVVIAVICRRGCRRRFNNSHDGNYDTEAVPFLPNVPNRAENFRGDAYVEMQSGEFIQEKRLKDRTTDDIAIRTVGMVRILAVDIVLEKLNAGQRWITVTGNAGDGKTTLGYLVLKEFLQKNVKVFEVKKPEEYDQIEKIKGEKVIMLDERFGAFLADEHLIRGWLDVIRKLLSFNDNDMHVIFVSRKSVVNESKMYLGQFSETMFDHSCMVDLSKLRVQEERLKILRYHLELENLTVSDELQEKISNKDIAHGFPHCCKIYSKLRSNGFDVDIEDFFESPLTVLHKTTNVLYRDKCKELFKLMIENGGKFDVYTLEDKDKKRELLQVVKEQEGSYINVLRNGICEFSHPSVYESVLNVINENDPLYCVQYATLSVIRQQMLITKSNEEDRRMSLCYIIVKPIPAVLKALAERFREDILKGDYSVFTLRLCQSKEFCEALISCCVDTDKTENGLKQFINQPGKDGETMLWTALKDGRMIAAEVLVKAQADVNIQDDRGRAPLHFILQLNTSAAATVVDDNDGKESVIMKITKLIIAEGKGDVNIRDQYGQTPLHYLCQLKSSAANDENQGRLDMDTIKLIVTDGRGDINIRDQYGHTPLHYLFKSNAVTREDIHWIITAARGNLNLCGQNKNTPLHHLCANSDLQLDTVDLVITKGKGDFNKGDEHGTTPLHFLCENEKIELDVVKRIINTSQGDINKQDNNGITPLHVLCSVSFQFESILSLITQRIKADRHGNTPLHFLCRRRGLHAGVLQQLERMPETFMESQNVLGYTPLDYLTDQDGSLPWTDGMLCRSVDDLVLCRFKQEDSWTTVLGPTMAFSPERVHDFIMVENFGRQLTNTGTCGNGEGSGHTWLNDTQSSGPALLHPPSYWETNSRLNFTEEKWNTLLQLGLVDADGNLDKERCNSTPCRSAYVSVTSKCILHKHKLCIQVFRSDQDMQYQIGECVTLSCPEASETITFKFGLAVDLRKGKVAFIDVENGQILGKVDTNFTQEVVPTFYVPSLDETFDTKLRLISGREIFVDNRKRQLIEQALSI